MVYSTEIALEQDVIDYLHCFGKINEVVNKWLDQAFVENIDICNKPAVKASLPTHRVRITITNDEYIELVKVYGGFNHPSISLKRMLYWLMYDEVLEQYGWKQLTKREKNENTLAAINKIFKDLGNLQKVVPIDLQPVANLLNELLEDLDG